MHPSRLLYTLILLCWFQLIANAQSTTTVVPFLNLMPDARSGAMGEAGVARDPDANSISSNPAKLPFLAAPAGMALSYSPWLRSLVPDMYLGYLSAYLKPAERDAIAVSLRYFSMGSIEFLGPDQEDLGSYKPAQLAVDATYARKLSDKFSLGTTFRYISAGRLMPQLENYEAGSAIRKVAADVSAYFRSPTRLFGSKARLAAGINLSNIGRSSRLENNPRTYELPTNLKLGIAATIFPDKQQEFSFAVDLNELLVAVPYTNTADGQPDQFATPIEKLSLGAGLEYLYKKQFALRAGYALENPKVGNRSYPTCGAGFTFNMLQMDVSYIARNIQKSPMANSLRFTLMFTFDPD
jgi:hypothetical protein